MVEPKIRTRSRDVESALVDAAEAVLVREGPQALTVRAVAQEAGVAPMGVYNRFGSKDGLIDSLLIRSLVRFAEELRADQPPDPLARLRASGMGYRRFALANPQHYQLLFGQPRPPGDPTAGAAGGAHERGPAEVQDDPVRTAGEAAFGVLVENVVIAMGAGVIQAGDPRKVAQTIWSGVHGAVSLEILGRLLVEDPEESYEAMLDLILSGLRPPGPA
jgi:AcrR family transcriptional regulator